MASATSSFPELLLETAGAALRVVPLADGWCAVILSQGGTDHRLGADSPDKVLMRLAAGLADVLGGKEVGKVRGLPVRAVLSLFEDHCSINATDENDRRVWFVHRADASLLATVRLPADDRARWLAAIQAAQGR